MMGGRGGVAVQRLKRVRWPLVILPALLVGGFEFVRHAFFEGYPAVYGNLAVAAMAAVGSFIYYHYALTLVERLNRDLHAEKERKALMDQRERIAGQLHDSLAQTLFFLNAELDRAIALLSDGKAEEALRPLREAKEGVSFAHQDLRETIEALRSTEWNKPLVPALKNLAATFYRQSGIEIDLHIPEELPELTSEERFTIFRIAQEALTNVRKHSGASKADLVVEREGNRLDVLVGDNGSGFDAAKVKPGIGLGEMKRLAREIGGGLSIEPRPEGGSLVRLSVPLPPERWTGKRKGGEESSPPFL